MDTSRGSAMQLWWLCNLVLIIGPSKAEKGLHKPAGPITARVWTNSSSSPPFVYPELSDGEFGMPLLQRKPNLGICVSGGGMRATTLALGWVRALWQMGVLQQARYIASNSGGSWFNGAMSYTQVPLKQFFGPYIPPQQLDTSAAQTLSPGSYGKAVNKAAPVMEILRETLLDLVTRGERVRAWSDAIGEAFLDPFAVGAVRSSVTTLGTRGRVHERVSQQAPSIPFLTAGTQGRPFPIILGSLILQNNPRKFFPFEFSPLYYGMPPLQLDTQPVALGGGMVEPLGFNSAPPTAGVVSPNGTKAVTVSSSSVVGLVQAVGVSSSFVAQKTQGGKEGREQLLSVEEFDYWNLWDFKGVNDAKFGDGGGHDNQAMTPLLRRGVENIIAGSATNCDPFAGAVEYAKCQYDISGLYGAVPLDMKPIDGVAPDLYNKMLQVFPKEGYTQFYNSMVSKLKAGQAPSIKQSLKVLPNPFLGIAGGYTANVLWLLNVKDTTWESALPKDTKKLLEDFRKGRGIGARKDAASTIYASLKEFPYITTFAMDYSPELTQMLSQMASYTVMQSEKDIKAMMAAATAKAQQQQPAAGAAKPAAPAGTASAGIIAAGAAAAKAAAQQAAAKQAVAAAALSSAVTAAKASAAGTAAAKPAGAAAAAVPAPAKAQGSNSTRT
uniref:Uncharacterized protein n=1 Tax=Tetradesmus obliquus TaxID=3088 RepID=A0A383VT98_TETOB|eukprot:jgi/Sobl393_1/7859/SZX68738.1